MTWTAAPYSSGQNLALRTVRISSNLSLRSKRIRRTDFALIESELEGHSEAACKTADAPRASTDPTRHHLCDDDADDAELAVLALLAGKI